MSDAFLARTSFPSRILFPILPRDEKHVTAADPIKVYDARWEVQEFSDDQIRRLFEATLAYGRRPGVDTITFTRDARLGCVR